MLKPLQNYSAIIGLALLAACQPPATQSPVQNRPQQAQSLSLQKPRTSHPVLQKSIAHGQIALHGNQLTLSLELYPKPQNPTAFRTQLLDLSTASKLQATVSDSHGKTYQANGADGDGSVNYTGGTITLTFDNLVPDELLFVEVQAKNGTTALVQAELATVLKHTTDATPVNATLNFQTTVAAKAMKALWGNDADRARAIDLGALENLTADITGVTGTAPNLSYLQNHPSLVNTALLASHLQAQNPDGLNAADYRQSGATVNLTVSGLVNSDTLQVQITDAASAVRTDLGNGNHSISGVTPGNGLRVMASAFGTPALDYTYSVTPNTLNPAEGESVNVSITATPVFNISSFSPAAGPTGTLVTVNGNGFTGTTAVSVGGANASFTVLNDNQMTVTVPTTAVDGQISITHNVTTQSATAFDVYRRIYVNDDAAGNNSGTSWANAYTSLHTALSAAGAQDEIWVAAGTYTPHASDRSVSFQMKENVNIYGGFAGTESAVSERTPDTTDFVTVLSGDLSGNDDYITPGSTMDENSYQVTRGANNAILDGVSIQGGNANEDGGSLSGGGMYNGSVSPTLSNIIFSNNTAKNGGGLYNSSSSPTLSHITFSNNSAGTHGGGLFNAGSSPQLTHVTFLKNTATNYGGAIYNSGSSARLSNVVFANNTASRGGGLYNTGGSPSLRNVTFSNNVGFGGAIYSIPTVLPTLKNVLFYNSDRRYVDLDPSQGVIEVGSNPFIDSTNPNGPDGIPRTADDGLRLAAGATGVINQGITDTDIPTTDILGNARDGAPEPGAYEYLPPALPAHVLGVDKNATGSGNGRSWSNAFTDLQSALAAATPGTEIWIAAGTYTPHTSDRTVSFQMKENVNIYGGFAGTELTRTERTPSLTDFVTVLSGDLSGNDDYETPGTTLDENSYRVTRGANNAILDGVTIQGGNRSGDSSTGAGMYNFGVSPTLTNIIFRNNSAADGAAMYNYNASPTLTNVTFSDNKSLYRGAGIYNRVSSSPVLTQVTFSSNTSSLQGAGIYNENSSPTLTHVTFFNNTTTENGGGMYNRNASPHLTHVTFLNNSASGGAGLYNTDSSPTLTNVTFSGNTASFGGAGMYSQLSFSTLTNVIFANNAATTRGGAIYSVSSSSSLTNATFSNNTSTFGGVDNADYDPSKFTLTNVLFYNNDRRYVDLDPSRGVIEVSSNPFVDSANPSGPDGIPHTADDGLRIAPTATAVINQGITDSDVPATDILGNERVSNPEPGAYEYRP